MYAENIGHGIAQPVSFYNEFKRIEAVEKVFQGHTIKTNRLDSPDFEKFKPHAEAMALVRKDEFTTVLFPGERTAMQSTVKTGFVEDEFADHSLPLPLGIIMASAFYRMKRDPDTAFYTVHTYHVRKIDGVPPKETLHIEGDFDSFGRVNPNSRQSNVT